MFEVITILVLSSVAEQPITPPVVVPIYRSKQVVVVKEAPRSERTPDKSVALYPDATVENLEKGLIKDPFFLNGRSSNSVIIPNSRNQPLQ